MLYSNKSNFLHPYFPASQVKLLCKDATLEKLENIFLVFSRS